jgi:hypothetical protein
MSIINDGNGENKKERKYLIPKSKVDRYGDREIYLFMSKWDEIIFRIIINLQQKRKQ